MVNGFDPDHAGALSPEARALIARRERVLGKPYRLFYREPLHLVRGVGAHLFDAEGHDYLDAYNNVPAVGHSNVRVQSAVAGQLRQLNTHTRYLTDEIVAYAERLTAKFEPELTQAIFTCTGSEAVDLAVRMTRRVTGGEGIIVTRNAYHGTTAAVAEITPSLGPGNPIPARTALVDAPDSVRGGLSADGAAAFLTQVRGAIEDFAARGIPFAGMIVDSVLSSDGLRLEPTGFLAAAAQLVREAGGLYIADEVQPGFGRTGDWWGYSRHGFVPDLVVLGKPMGNGLPIAGVVGSPQIFDAFGSEVRYFNTFGGSPVSIAAATAVLDEIEQRGLLAHAAHTGELLATGLRSIAADLERAGGSSRIAEVRGAGLFLSVEYVDPDDGTTPDRAAALEMVNRLRDRRILVSASGTYENVLKIRPPLVFDTEATSGSVAVGAGVPRAHRRDSDRFLEGFADASRELG